MNRVNAPDGTPLVYDAYLPADPGRRPTVLFLHDWSDDATQWADFGAALRDAGYATYVLDQRGHGRSGGRHAHLSRFSQLLGDLQAFRRAVRRERDVRQVIGGVGFGALVVLRYLETQPADRPAGAIVANPWLAPRQRAALWKRAAAQLADLWPTLPTGMAETAMTAGARAEIAWAQRAVQADAARIECPTLFVLGGADAETDPELARRFAAQLRQPGEVRWHAPLAHDVLRVREVLQEVSGFLGTRELDRRSES
jgi:alpha-beta hydrolase superfamily lysophospholipase